MPRKPKLEEEKPELKKQKAVSPLAKWQAHLKEFRVKHPKLSLKDAMIKAKTTYKKSSE